MTATARSGSVGQDVDASAQFERVFSDAVRAEATALRAELLVGADVDPETEPSRNAAAVYEALRAIRRRDAARAGALGERVAKARSQKLRIPAASGRAKFRIPDILSDTELVEIKNVARLRLTHQLSDFLAYCDFTQRRFVLVTRPDTMLSSRLLELIATGRVEHRHFSGLLSATGRRVLRRLIDDALSPGGEPAARGPEPPSAVIASEGESSLQH
jgi:hypothetical protein